MNKRLISVVIVVVLGAMVATALLWTKNSPDTPNGTDKTKQVAQEPSQLNFRLKWLWYSGWAGELWAEQENLWEQNGLDVDIRPGGFELDPIKLVISGEDQVGVAGADQILMAQMNGVPLVAFAVQYQQSPVGFVSMADSGIKSVADFRGKKIGVKYGTDVEPVYRALLSKAGLSKEDVIEIPVKFDLAPFFSGAIDVYPGYLTNDLLLPAENGYEVNTIDASAEGVHVYGNVYFCSEKFLSENPDQLVSFLTGIREGWIASLASPPEKIADLAIAKSDGLNREHEVRVTESLGQFIVPEGSSFGQMTEMEWEHLYTILREQGVLDRDFDFHTAYSMEILERLTDAN